MAQSNESLELVKFYNSIQQEIKSEQISDEEGGTLEQLFTQFALKLLSDSGDTENTRLAYNEKVTKVGVQHKINAYAMSDNYETIDLFITLYNGADDFVRIGKEDIDKAAKRIANFFKNAVYKEYVSEIEEASEIFDFAHTLSESKELKETLVRVNAFIISDGVFLGEPPSNLNISGFPFNFRIIDLTYLYNIFEKSYMPIEIDFKTDGFKIPCIMAPTPNEEYQSYLAIISGDALANIYERYGSRLLEQNVRSFLQFTGKINKGIRNTIIVEPEMFLAFNNGIAATADSIELEGKSGGAGMFITKVNDLQIVNGGQTTASIYHTWKKDKVNIANVFVQLKLNVIKNKEKFSDIVSQISEYANTQNKVSVSDLSSNRPYHIDLEKLSRGIWAAPNESHSIQTRWFYERARGQYKNARIKEGFTVAKQKAFDNRNPKPQVFSKDDLAKYINAYEEVFDGRKLVIGPHYVVRGNQKNYAQFINHNIVKKPDSIYFEDIIAKAILFRATEKEYGVKPNSIGDMRYITVPYSIALFNYCIKSKLDLYKIWKNQSVSSDFKTLIHSLMVQVELHIKKAAPGSLYGEWAKEDCWEDVKRQKFNVDFILIKDDLIDVKNPPQRRKISDDDAVQAQIEMDNEILRSVPSKIWSTIEEWGKTTKQLTDFQQTIAWNLAHTKATSKITDSERNIGLKIIDIVRDLAPEILAEIDNLLLLSSANDDGSVPAVNHDLIKKLVSWDKKNKRLKDHEYLLMADIADGKKELTSKNSQLATWNVLKAKKYGFKE